MPSYTQKRHDWKLRYVINEIRFYQNAVHGGKSHWLLGKYPDTEYLIKQGYKIRLPIRFLFCYWSRFKRPEPYFRLEMWGPPESFCKIVSSDPILKRLPKLKENIESWNLNNQKKIQYLD